ncbi:S1 RNA-binding domain-containing protein [Acaryochloris marina]|uniref:30S ribosomal protein S1 n=1 Tax=Acaryochloris marina (strain MBIC 11017) TaxID=329726 RepID=B0C7U0_ACAM1|nr:S1 RNA-binding domain-containing protein [Acaryochloris marina]ABW26481.1 30S ribosomal protein S1 [Acaryochloris marina MBIC11017]BDM81293.1 30S ribosomal protein S1 [Acaryochloris marina MBIC10699]
MSFSADDFAKALSQHDYSFEVGQTVQGKTVNYDSDGAYIDIGGKATAFLPSQEASLRKQFSLEEIVPLDEEREFLIIKGQDANGQVTLSIRRLELKHLWTKLLELQSQSQSVQVTITGVNKGGVTADVEGLRGFIPRSHLLDRDNLEGQIGSQLTVTFLEVDPDRKKLVLSNRMAEQSSRIGELEIGQLVSGTVSDLKPFGAFIKLDGLTGLLHIKEVSQNFVPNLSAVLKIGEPIKAIVLDLDPGRGRVSLSTKVLENRPGEIVDSMEQVMAEAEIRANRYLEKMRQQ